MTQSATPLEAQPRDGPLEANGAGAPDSNGGGTAANANGSATAVRALSKSSSHGRSLSGTSSRSLLSMSYGDLSRWVHARGANAACASG